HFFELGGHSLLAVQVVSHVRDRLKVEVALRELFMQPVLQDFAAQITTRAPRRAWSPLVPLTDAQKNPVVYMVPGVVMTAIAFRELAQSLDGRMNVHVLEALGLEENQVPCARMEEIVDLNISAMRENELPEGKIVLAGHSFGGSVAFEMARVLEASGHNVQLLLLDNLLVLPKRMRINEKADGIVASDQRLKKLFDAQVAIYKRYEPSGQFQGTVDLINARDDGLPERVFLQACKKYCGQQPVVSWVSGDHHSMLEAPHVRDLSDAIWKAWSLNRSS
ncbi:MAG: thioesterase domain-containing protein, partial [Pseudomonadota bacterium]|nr:thioesterase domain-containing protein [Pseudomonadota bacterium]